MAEFANTFWSLSLPAGWSARNDAECAEIQREEVGAGAIYVSTALSDAPLTDDALIELATPRMSTGVEATALTLGDFTGFYLQYRHKAMFCRQWLLRRGATALFVTYCCPAEFEGHEDAAVDSVLASLTARELAA